MFSQLRNGNGATSPTTTDHGGNFDKVQFDALPNSRKCRGCGKFYFKKSLIIHTKKCEDEKRRLLLLERFEKEAKEKQKEIQNQRKRDIEKRAKELQPEFEFEIIEDENGRKRCGFCGRFFAKDRHDQHQSVCGRLLQARTGQKPSSIYDSRIKRMNGINAPNAPISYLFDHSPSRPTSRASRHRIISTDNGSDGTYDKGRRPSTTGDIRGRNNAFKEFSQCIRPDTSGDIAMKNQSTSYSEAPFPSISLSSPPTSRPIISNLQRSNSNEDYIIHDQQHKSSNIIIPSNHNLKKKEPIVQYKKVQVKSYIEESEESLEVSWNNLITSNSYQQELESDKSSHFSDVKKIGKLDSIDIKDRINEKETLEEETVFLRCASKKIVQNKIKNQKVTLNTLNRKSSVPKQKSRPTSPKLKNGHALDTGRRRDSTRSSFRFTPSSPPLSPTRFSVFEIKQQKQLQPKQYERDYQEYIDMISKASHNYTMNGTTKSSWDELVTPSSPHPPIKSRDDGRSVSGSKCSSPSTGRW